MKKQTWIEILVIAALAAGWFYMEKTESLTVFVKEDMTKEKFWRKCRKLPSRSRMKSWRIM